MEAALLRPILSGIVGGLLTVWFLSKISRWVPTTCEGRPVKDLQYDHRWKLRIANAIGLAGLLGGVAVYKLGLFASNDWRGASLAFGFACIAPVITLAIAAAPGGELKIREALVAYAVGQSTPPMLLYSIIALGAVLFFFTVASL